MKRHLVLFLVGTVFVLFALILALTGEALLGPASDPSTFS
jgi:hypothetical protein